MGLLLIDTGMPEHGMPLSQRALHFTNQHPNTITTKRTLMKIHVSTLYPTFVQQIINVIFKAHTLPSFLSQRLVTERQK